MKRKSSFVSDSLDTSWSDSVVIKIIGEKTSGLLKDDSDIFPGRQKTFFSTMDPDVSDEKSDPRSDDRYKASHGPRKERRKRHLDGRFVKDCKNRQIMDHVFVLFWSQSPAYRQNKYEERTIMI